MWGWIYNTVGEENSAEQREVEIMSPQLFIFNELMFNPTWLLSVDKQVRKMVTTGKVMFAGESAWRVLCLPHNSRRSVEVFFSNGHRVLAWEPDQDDKSPEAND